MLSKIGTNGPISQLVGISNVYSSSLACAVLLSAAWYRKSTKSPISITGDPGRRGISMPSFCGDNEDPAAPVVPSVNAFSCSIQTSSNSGSSTSFVCDHNSEELNDAVNNRHRESSTSTSLSLPVAAYPPPHQLR